MTSDAHPTYQSMRNRILTSKLFRVRILQFTFFRIWIRPKTLRSKKGLEFYKYFKEV
jgi:hypothetical protein